MLLEAPDADVRLRATTCRHDCAILLSARNAVPFGCSACGLGEGIFREVLKTR
jgi:hypothetical protein